MYVPLTVLLALRAAVNWTKPPVPLSPSINVILDLQDAVDKKSSGLKKLVGESQTPKGLNEQALRELQKGKFYSKLNVALNNIHKKLNK